MEGGGGVFCGLPGANIQGSTTGMERVSAPLMCLFEVFAGTVLSEKIKSASSQLPCFL